MSQEFKPKDRSLSREMALQILFQWEFSKTLDFQQSLQLYEENFSLHPSSLEYARQLLNGIIENKEALDSLVSKYATHWHIDRLSLVDKNVMRIALYELKYLNFNPRIAINEAVNLAKKYGTQDSGAFVNGVLDRIAKAEFGPKPSESSEP